MTILRTDTVSGIGTEGTVLEGNITIDSLNYMTLPKGTTSQRYSLEGRDPDYHKLKLHLPLVHHTQFDDYSPASPSITANYDSHISSLSGVFENSAALFSRQGANDWIAISDSTDNDLGSDDFTIECWFMCAEGGTNGYLVQKGTVSGNWSYFIQFREATDSINFYGTSDGTNFDIVNGTSFGSTAILPNKWYHVAVCRSGNTFSYYINGKKGSTTDTSSASFHNSSVDLRIPQSGGFGATEKVFLQDVRLYKGVAKYSDSFTPQKLAEDGAIRYNTDSNKIECYNGTKWMNIAVSSPDLGGNGGPAGNPTGYSADQVAGARGIVMGGNPGTDKIDYLTISTAGDAIDFGDLLTASSLGASGGSRTRGICVIGTPSHSDKLEFITISSTGDAQDFGDQTHTNHKRNISCGGSATRMIVAGGVFGTNPYTYYNTMEFVTIASTGNTVDFGEMTEARTQPFAASSPTRFVTLGGYKSPSPNASDIIEFVTTASTGNSQDFGDLMEGNSGSPASCSNSTRAITFGGRIDGTSTTTSKIQTVQIATGGNARKFGDLTQSVRFGSGTSSKTRGVRIAGYAVPANADQSTMDYINISTEGDAVDFGNLTRSTRSCGTSTSSDHGGL